MFTGRPLFLEFPMIFGMSSDAAVRSGLMDRWAIQTFSHALTAVNGFKCVPMNQAAVEAVIKKAQDLLLVAWNHVDEVTPFEATQTARTVLFVAAVCHMCSTMLTEAQNGR